MPALSNSSDVNVDTPDAHTTSTSPLSDPGAYRDASWLTLAFTTVSESADTVNPS